MAFLTNYKFWIIFAILLVLLAIVGYLAENTGIIKKKQDKKPEKTNEKVKEVVQEVTYTPLVEVDTPIETLNINDEWSDNTKKDDKQEQTYQAPADDWMNLPDMNNKNTK